jgi:serine phosphatase RsbU (regulator of sigma subunit)
MGTELKVARQIQQMILPKPEELKKIKALDIAGFMEAADEVGGDWRCHGTWT